MRSLASAVALVAIIVLVPMALVAVGSTTFAHLDLSHLGRLFSSGRENDPHLVTHWLAGGALAIAWLTWAWMTVCVVVEMRARKTGRAAGSLPASRTMQSVVACLVGTALAISAARTPGQTTPSVSAAAGRNRLGPAAMHRRDATMSSFGASVPSLRVIDDLTETGFLWAPEIDSTRAAGSVSVDLHRDHQGRAERGHIRLPGADPVETIGVPIDPNDGSIAGALALDTDRHGIANAHEQDPTHLVSPRETLWSIAARRLGSPLRWREIAELNYDVVQPDGDALTRRHWIRPGWSLLLPSGRENHGTEHREGRMIDHPGSPAETDAPDRLGESPWGSRLPVAPLGGGVVGAGVAGMLDRMRRAQQRYRRSGTYIRLPDESARTMEERLRIGDGQSVCSHVDRSLEILAQWSADRWPLQPSAIDGPINRPIDRPVDWVHGGPPDIVGVVVGPEHLKVITRTGAAGRTTVTGSHGTATGNRAMPSGLPEGWSIEPDGHMLVVERARLDQASVGNRGLRSARNPAPTLVTAGTGLDGTTLVNVEALGSLIVRGDADRTDSVLRALALELATSYWSGRFDLVLVGFGAELQRFQRVATSSDIEPLAQRLLMRRLRGEEQLKIEGFGSFAEARRQDHSTRWDPMVVVCGPDVPPDEAAELLEVGSEPCLGSAVIAAGDQLAGVHEVTLTDSDPAASLGVLSSVLFVQRVHQEELDQVGALFDTAADKTSVPATHESYVDLSVALPPVPDDHARRTRGGGSIRVEVTDCPEIEVAVLGEVEVRGAVRDFSRAWARELVVYLAMHRNGASSEAWATALWPDRLMAPSSLHSTASVARRSLGQDRNGRDHLPRSHGRLVLADTVGTDWDRFVRLSRSDDVGHWREALALVRGRPFEGLRSSDWPILEGIAPAIESAVVDASERLSEVEIAARNPREAEWAARKGLLVSPYDERLYRVLMRSADLDGNPAGVESVMSELVKLVADDIEPYDSVHPNTLELYLSLTKGRSASRRPKAFSESGRR